MKTYQKKPMMLITSKYEVLRASYEPAKGMRLMWTCSDLEVYVVGPLKGLLYEQAANIAMNECISRGIRPGSLRAVKSSGIFNALSTETKRMF